MSSTERICPDCEGPMWLHERGPYVRGCIESLRRQVRKLTKTVADLQAKAARKERKK